MCKEITNKCKEKMFVIELHKVNLKSWYVWISEHLDVTAIRFFHIWIILFERLNLFKNSRVIRVLRISCIFSDDYIIVVFVLVLSLCSIYIFLWYNTFDVLTNLTQTICTYSGKTHDTSWYFRYLRYLKYSYFLSHVQILSNYPNYSNIYSPFSHLISVTRNNKKVSGQMLWKNNWLILFTVIPFKVIPLDIDS